MSRLLALTKRELEAYFFAPVPWVLTFFYLLLTWYFFQWEMSERYVVVSYKSVFVALDFSLFDPVLIPDRQAAWALWCPGSGPLREGVRWTTTWPAY